MTAQIFCDRSSSRRRFSILASVLTLACIAGGAMGQERPRITITGDTRVGLEVRPLGGPQGAVATAILNNDLDLSGWFQLGAQSAARVQGQANANRLFGEVLAPDGRVLFSKEYSGPPRRIAHQFADDIVQTLVNRPGIAASTIAFIGQRSGRKEVYTSDYDGANLQQLTRDGAISVSPALSPDGRMVAYTGYQSGFADIYLIDLANGGRRPIIRAPGTNSGAAFSPDGRSLALTMSKDGNPEIYLTSTTGGGARRLTRSPSVETSPSWAPDGRSLVITSDVSGSPQLYRLSTGGGGMSRISTGHGYSSEPDVSPDGQQIAFNVRSGGTNQVAIVGAGGGQARVIGAGDNPVWGANSRHLIFARGSQIILFDTFTGRSTPVVSNAGRVSEPTWSRR
ncbi:MAG: biopolymer transporter Tol [Verrucomicrobiales bacterium]